MSDLRITATPGYDHRDDPGSLLGASGLTLSFAVVSPNTAPPWAVSMDVLTGWMARPLADDGGAMGRKLPLPRRHMPGLDGVEHRSDPIGAVYICVPRGQSAAPSRFTGPDRAGACPWLGVPCVGDVLGYHLADDGLTALIEGGEDALADWLRRQAKEALS